ncbi:MAG TPA: carbohydrate kinase family protein, partial [Anaerolineales bacterium]
MAAARLSSQVVVIGNVGIDTNAYLAGQDIDWQRETNFTENIDSVGQAGGYASRGYAQLGYPTAFIGTVGDDFSGRFVRAELESDGIDTRGLFLDP